MIEFKNVKYKGVLSVNSLQIEEKKVSFIVGKSGSGKSTLLKLVNKIVSPNKGSIFYKGENIENIDSVSLRKKVVMVPQNIIIFDGTIRDNLLKALEFRKDKLIGDKDLNEILKVISLEKSLDTDANKLSGGEKQRLILGRALALSCEVLMLDEPTASLDENTSEIIMSNIIEFAKTKEITLLVITHNLKLAELYSERTIEILGGEIIRE